MAKGVQREPYPRAGKRFGNWTFVALAGKNRHRMRLAEVICSCGKRDEIILANLTAGVSRGCSSCASKRNWHKNPRSWKGFGSAWSIEHGWTKPKRAKPKPDAPE